MSELSAESPNMVYGRLLESAHLTGYTAERAFAEFDWLLEKDRWKQVGAGHKTIDTFLAALDSHFAQFKLAIEQRQKIAQRLAELQASQRQTAKALGVSHQTVGRDRGPHGPPQEKKPQPDQAASPAAGPHGPDESEDREEWRLRKSAHALATILRSVPRIALASREEGFITAFRKAQDLGLLEMERADLETAIDALTRLSKEATWE